MYRLLFILIVQATRINKYLEFRTNSLVLLLVPGILKFTVLCEEVEVNSEV
jgi:hypothetical protein